MLMPLPCAGSFIIITITISLKVTGHYVYPHALTFVYNIRPTIFYLLLVLK
jgi:hypothetical protein